MPKKKLCDGCQKAQNKFVLSVENLKLFESKQKPEKSEECLDVDTEISGVKRLREWDIYGVLFKKDNESYCESDCSFSVKSATTCDTCWCPYDEGVDVDSDSDAE